ncbi:hypothetical protein SAMN06265379_104189 [Saccharicrinis carchari]|uniref:Uncharacterized protein n=1 Tax=Saccharicrinis carchari TaxID=1168039 RepID=A0A521D3V2_SACCC|nr:DUF6686 family protein [Saccharicrinis carchari]SMO66337.1 hypothetical protein SAMN06265379_104189 [Saccharicrinis carchari]
MENINIKSQHGHLFTCNKCNKFHFEFNQIAIDFSSVKALENFQNYLIEINGEEFELLNIDTFYNRKIHIPFPNTAIKMVLSQNDLKELKVLVTNFINHYKRAQEDTRMLKNLSIISEKQLN